MLLNLDPRTACAVTQLTKGQPQTRDVVSIYFRYMYMYTEQAGKDRHAL